MADLQLIIGNYNYSSWSLRPWYYLTQQGMDFETVRISLFTETMEQEMSPYFSDGKVPVLRHGDLEIWDSLAIIEYLAELHPEARGHRLVGGRDPGRPGPSPTPSPSPTGGGDGAGAAPSGSSAARPPGAAPPRGRGGPPRCTHCRGDAVAGPGLPTEHLPLGLDHDLCPGHLTAWLEARDRADRAAQTTRPLIPFQRPSGHGSPDFRATEPVDSS